jgi:hypothetical protein
MLQAAQTSSSSSGVVMFRRFREWANPPTFRQQPVNRSSQLVIPAFSNRTFSRARQASHSFVFLPTRFIGFFAVKTVFRSIGFRSDLRHGFFARRGVFLVSVLFQPIFYALPAFRCAELLLPSFWSSLCQGWMRLC